MPYKDRTKRNENGLKLYYKNHENNKQRRRQYYYDNRFKSNFLHYGKKKQLMEILMQEECICCGYSDIRALTFDHIYGGGTKGNGRGDKYRHGIRMEYYIAHPLEAIATLQILCHNCNQIKRIENEEFRGWAWGYKNKFNYTISEDRMSKILEGANKKRLEYHILRTNKKLTSGLGSPIR